MSWPKPSQGTAIKTRRLRVGLDLSAFGGENRQSDPGAMGLQQFQRLTNIRHDGRKPSVRSGLGRANDDPVTGSIVGVFDTSQGQARAAAAADPESSTEPDGGTPVVPTPPASHTLLPVALGLYPGPAWAVVAGAATKLNAVRDSLDGTRISSAADPTQRISFTWTQLGAGPDPSSVTLNVRLHADNYLLYGFATLGGAEQIVGPIDHSVVTGSQTYQDVTIAIRRPGGAAWTRTALDSADIGLWLNYGGGPDAEVVDLSITVVD